MIELLTAVISKIFWIIVVVIIFGVFGLFDSGQRKRTSPRKKEDDAETKWLKWREKRDEELKAKKQKDNLGSE